MLGRNILLRGSEVLEQGAQRGCRYLVSGGIQNQVGCDPGQPDPVVGNTACGRGIETK